MDNVDQLVAVAWMWLHPSGEGTYLADYQLDEGNRAKGWTETPLYTADTITSLQAQLDKAREALKPFAAFSVPGAPDDFAITGGSPFAQKQLTAGDCRNARAALGEQS